MTDTIQLIDLDTGETMEVPKDKVNHPAAGLQFSGEPTERALRAKKYINHAKKDLVIALKMIKQFGESKGSVFRLKYCKTILEALELMAEERR
jgi:hypothetical protein